IPNGVPTDTFTPGPLRVPVSGARLLFVGNWRDPRQGLPYLLEAVEIVRRQGPAVYPYVAGGGWPGTENAEGVTCHGGIASEEAIAERYRACDIFVAPSTGQESFGIVLLEAMACGRPVVCSDISGYRAVVEPAGARLVPPRDASALARTILDLA